jgi:Flp pilus assembly protein TadD
VRLDPLPSSAPPLGLAVDVGTTKLAAYLVDMRSGQTLAQAGAPNPQIAYGEDVISRIAYANAHAAGLCNTLGYLLQAMGDLAGARPYYERALAIREAALGPDHPDTALSLNNLAILCYYEGKPEEAARLMRRALAIWEAKLGPGHPDTQNARRSLAAIEERLQEGDT